MMLFFHLSDRRSGDKKNIFLNNNKFSTYYNIYHEQQIITIIYIGRLVKTKRNDIDTPRTIKLCRLSWFEMISSAPPPDSLMGFFFFAPRLTTSESTLGHSRRI